MDRCLICDSQKNIVVTTGLLDGAEKQNADKSEGQTVVQCLECGLYYYLPQPSKRGLKAYHDKSYFIASSPQVQTGYPDYIDEAHKAVKVDWGMRMMQWLYQFDKTKSGTKRVLDIGCATGFTTYGMSQFQLCNVEPVGIDVSEWAIQYAKQAFPEIPFVCGELKKAKRYMPFDYAVFWDSLEHFPDLHKVIRTVSKLLRHNGLILIQTPDGEKSTPDWYYWSPHQHTCIFTFDSLSKLLGLYGIKIIKKRCSLEADEMILIAQKWT